MEGGGGRLGAADGKAMGGGAMGVLIEVLIGVYMPQVARLLLMERQVVGPEVSLERGDVVEMVRRGRHHHLVVRLGGGQHESGVVLGIASTAGWICVCVSEMERRPKLGVQVSLHCCSEHGRDRLSVASDLEVMAVIQGGQYERRDER